MKLMGLEVVPFLGRTFMAGLLLAAGSFAAAAQEAGQPAVNAVTGSGWSAEVTPSEDTGPTQLPEDQTALIEQINVYLDNFTNVTGKFVQTNPDSGQQKGTFYMLRPGKMRFDYARPSKLRIVSDGDYLSIEDHDLNTQNKYPLESTPFRMLLVKDVKLQRDARILSISNSDATASIALSDRSGKSAGRIQLFFAYPQIELKEWIITDAQGLNTRVEVLALSFDKKLDPSLFKASKIALKNVFGDQ